MKLATKYTYTMPSAHYHHAYGRDFVGAGFTIGGHIPIGGDKLGPYVDTDVSFAWLGAPRRSRQVLPNGAADTYNEQLLQPRLRALFGWRFADHFGIFGGPSLLFQARILRDGDEAILRHPSERAPRQACAKRRRRRCLELPTPTRRTLGRSRKHGSSSGRP